MYRYGILVGGGGNFGFIDFFLVILQLANYALYHTMIFFICLFCF